MASPDTQFFNETDVFQPEFLGSKQPQNSPRYTTDSESVEFDDIIEAGNSQPERKRNDNLPHYGISLILPIPLLADSSPQFFMGDFHPKHEDPTLGSRSNTPNFERLRLMPFRTRTYNIPFEASAEYLAEDEKEVLSNYDPGTLKATLANTARQTTISAGKWSEQIYGAYKPQGFTILSGLTGIESYAEAESILKEVFDIQKIRELYPQSNRVRFSYELEPPFIDAILLYLENDAIANVAKSSDKVRATLLKNELLVAARTGFNFLRSVLTTTEEQIATKKKKYYDMPDWVRIDARPPLDLVAMIHLDKLPKEDESLAIATATGKAIGDRQTSTQTEPPEGFVSLESVQQMMADQASAIENAITEKMTRLFGQSSNPLPPPPTTAKQETPPDNKPKSGK